jgi:tetratricopeptide (TPR) repeat protein
MLKKKLSPKNEARLQDLLRRGHALEQQQRVDEALVEYRKALEMDPGNAGACQLAGMLYHKRGDNELAEPLLAKAVKAFPTKADLQCAYGAALTALEQHQKASRHYRKAVELNPHYLIAQFNYAESLVYLGDTEGAIEGFQRALEIEPLCAPAYQQLAGLRKFREYDDDVRIMEQLHAQLEGEDRKLLAFGLSAAHKKLGNYDKSFEYMLDGNRLHRATLNYAHEQSEQIFRGLQRAFDAEALSAEVLPPGRGPTPIFIVGMPRSGTTLAEQILASHSAVHGCGELKNMGRIYRDTFASDRDLITQVRQLPAGTRRDLARRYLDYVAALAAGKPYTVDKMPHNFMYVGLIALLFPNARIVHCERNPMDNCLSIFSYLFSGSHPYASDLEELGQYYLLYRELMAHWERALPGRIHTLNYERVVADTDGEVRKLLDYCGLPFEEACLSFFENDRAVSTISATQVRRPIYTSSVEAWRVYESGLTPLKKALGL